MEEDLKIKADLVIPGSELWFTASRSGGPGGQHVNKSSTRVTLHWDPSGSRVLNERQRERILRRLSPRVNSQGIVQVSVETTRSQLRNREMARKRLAGLILDALKVRKRRIPTKVRASAKQRRLESKRRRGAVKRMRGRPSDLV